MDRKQLPKESLAKNLRFLLDLEKISEEALAKKSGVAQKTINNILNGVSGGNLSTIAKLAESFGLNAWHLIMPGLPNELVSGKSIEKLYLNYISSSEEGRRYIDFVAEREAKYGHEK